MQLCYGDKKLRSPPPVIPPLTLILPLVDTPTPRTSLSDVAHPSSCGPPCGGIRPKTSKCAMSSTTSPTHTAESPGPLPHRLFLTSGNPLPPFPITWKVAPAYVTPSIYCAPPPASCRPTPIGLSQGN